MPHVFVAFTAHAEAELITVVDLIVVSTKITV